MKDLRKVYKLNIEEMELAQLETGLNQLLMRETTLGNLSIIFEYKLKDY